MTRWVPLGTPYHGATFARVVYQLHGATLTVGYVAARVKTIETTSPYYRSASGLGVRAYLPRHLCTRLDDIGHVGPPGCTNTWRGFAFDGECLDAWLSPPRAKTITMLYMHHSRRITRILVGDPNVILPCF